MKSRPYFRTKARLKALEKILGEWEGTPFAHWTGVKQRGCDCIHFIVRVLEECGIAIGPIPWYPKDWHIHNDAELLLNGMLAEPRFMKADVDNPINGDIILYKFGKVSSHSGFYLDDYVYQAITGIGVERRHWIDRAWYKRRSHAFRLMEAR